VTKDEVASGVFLLLSGALYFIATIILTEHTAQQATK
jgi:hypothetical protein